MKVDIHGHERPDGLPYSMIGWILVSLGGLVIGIAVLLSHGEEDFSWAALYWGASFVALGMPFVWVGAIIHAISFVASSPQRVVSAVVLDETEQQPAADN